MSDTNNQVKSTSKLMELPKRPGGGGGHMARMRGGEKAKNTKGTLLRLLKYFGNNKMLLFLSIVLIIISVIATLTASYMLRPIINELVNSDISIADRLMSLGKNSLILAFWYVTASVCTLVQSSLMIKAAQNITQQLRDELFAKALKMPIRYFDEHSHGDLMSRLTNDIDNISNCMNTSAVQFITSLCTVVGTLILMLSISPVLTFLSVIIIPFMFLYTQWLTKKARPKFKDQQKYLGELNGIIEETVSGEYVVRAFCHEEEAIEEFEKKNEQLKKSSIAAQIWSTILMPSMNMFNNIGYAFTAAMGGLLMVRSLLDIGGVVTFLNYSKQFSRPINEIANQYTAIQSAIAGAERVFEVFDTEPEFTDDEDAVEIADLKGKVIFKDVDFGYNSEKKILSGISFEANPGDTIAIVGPTGAGKTTIINLLMRFYEAENGEITIDNVNIRKIKKDFLRKSFGIVLQDTHLFSESIKDNIRYANPNASDEEVIKAAKMANIHDFISRLPKGYDTIIEDDGGVLSQGQRQLLAIARAMLNNPSMLILDEATRSVDTRTELHIQEAMLKLMEGRTSFVIAHRLSTIRNADKILVIDGGKICESGTHDELIEKGGHYANLYNKQFEPEEIES